MAERSYERLNRPDLRRLADFAAHDLDDRLRRHPRWEPYRTRVICVALCQGAALHYVDKATGVKDFDLWTFLDEIPGKPFPPRWRTTADFGVSRFGRRESEEHGTYVGRRIDFIGRSLRVEPSVELEPRTVLREYLTARKTKSARCLAEKAVVLLAPSDVLGEVIWPIKTKMRQA